MTLVTAAIILVVAGAILWFIEKYVPLSEPFRIGLRLLAALFVILVFLSLFDIVTIPIK